MFKHKPKILVIKAQTDTRDVEVSEAYYMGYDSGRNNKTTTTKKVPYTTVLMSKDGELCTREFNGDWDVDDIKAWEDL